MFRISRKRPWPPSIDTTTIRAELNQIRQDLEHVPELHPAALMLADTIEELENAEARTKLGDELSLFKITRAKKPGGGSP